jgi:carbonic anhydrase
MIRSYVRGAPALVTGECLAAAILTGAAAYAEGTRQSPIDIKVGAVVNAAADQPIVGNFSSSATLDVVNTFDASGKIEKEWATLKANVPTGSSVQIGEAKYNLLQFHFHTPSEHTVNGAHTPMEVHFVFLREGAAPCGRAPDALLVIGARIRSGAANAELGKIFDQANLPANAAAAHLAVADFNVGNVLGNLNNSWRYSGSLTAPASFAPACDEPEGSVERQLESETLPENVSWVVLTHTLAMSPKQIAVFKNLFPEGNTRETQPLHDGRAVTAHGAAAR